MNKIIAVSMALLMLMGCFVGCEKDPSDPASTTSDPTAETPSGTDTDFPSDSGTSDAQTDLPGADSTETPSTAVGDDPHVHSYGEWTETQKPTCTRDGLRTRSCACGDTETERIGATGHNYVDDVCTNCGDIAHLGELRILEDLAVDSLLYCTDRVIAFRKDGKNYLADRNGNILTEGYDGMNCPGTDNYVVAHHYSKEVIGTTEDEDFGILEIVRHTYDFDVLDQNGKVIFSRSYECVEYPMSENVFDGEYIDSCNEGRIITYTPETYHFGSSHSACTVKIYDLQGNCLSTLENVRDVGTYLDGELLLLMDDPCQLAVADKNGKVIRTGFDDSTLRWLTVDSFFPNNEWTTAGFVNGYAMLRQTVTNGSPAVLISEDFSEYYLISYALYLKDYRNNGTVVASKIVANGMISEEYYLIDLAKCQTDAEGFCIPTLDAAVSKEPFDEIHISCLFGQTTEYVLVSRDGQWGYLSMDGSDYEMFDDAGFFCNGIAIVIKDGLTFLIDEDFNQISQSLKGYSSVSSWYGGVFLLKSEEGNKVAVYGG